MFIFTVRYFPVIFACLLLAGCESRSRSLRLTAEAASPTVAPTSTIEPTAAPVLTETPAATQTAEDHYLTIAQTGALPTVRPGMPKGAWTARAQNLGQGPEVRIEFPMTIGLSNEQTVRQAKRQGAGIMKRLFDADPALARVNIIGTLPDGPNQAEQPAVSILIERAAYAAWDGSAESLPWNVSPRLN